MGKFCTVGHDRQATMCAMKKLSSKWMGVSAKVFSAAYTACKEEQTLPLSKKKHKKRRRKKTKMRVKKKRSAGEHSRGAPDLVTDSERDTPASGLTRTTLPRTDSIDTKRSIRDQEHHKRLVRASLWDMYMTMLKARNRFSGQFILLKT